MSSSYTITKKKKRDKNQYILGISFVLLLGSFFIPLVVLLPLQQALYHPFGYWFLEPPRSAYFIFTGSLILLSLSLLMMISGLAKNKLAKGLIAAGIFVSILLSVLSVDHYHYMNGNGIYINPFFGFGEKEFLWADVKEAKQIAVEEKNGLKDKNLTFVFKDGEQYSFLITETVRKAYPIFNVKLQEKGIQVTREFPE
ncbi:hypothetical protein LCM00_22660 [Bacillus infantis]|uniref:hypothetical protein n=1 Tax=Bacillus infantis TaxID=324767 RepID=UPI001CD4E5AF|nr:hypothetical protein [Bacillus infantis]MCA1042299.1 hypothetical protein [Bacillus infantis]